jgi:3-hydroxybutyryl-CoA dehydratase
MIQKPFFEVGSSVSVSRTISESDVYLFGGLTGDLGPNHIDAEYSRKTAYGRRVVHGAYLVGLASAASTLMGSTYDKGDYRGASYGYDKVRFVRPVFIGDTVTMTYTIREIDPSELKTYAEVLGTNQDGTIVFAAVHIAKGLPKKKESLA